MPSAGSRVAPPILSCSNVRSGRRGVPLLARGSLATSRPVWRIPIPIAFLLLLAPLSPASAQPVLREPATLEAPAPPSALLRPPRGGPELEALAEPYRRFLEDVDVLITDAERAAFLALTEDYRRDAFIREFWKLRDADPRTARNERREDHEKRLAEAKRLFGVASDTRSRAMLVFGVPDERFEVACGGVLWPTEAWFYLAPQGSSEAQLASASSAEPLAFLFYRRWGAGHWQVWDGEGGARAFYRDDSAGGSTVGCNYEQFQLALQLIGKRGLGYVVLLAQIEHPPKPKSSEWVDTFASYSTDLPAGTASFSAELSLRFPGRHGRRTVVEGVLTVPVDEAGRAELGGHASYNFVVNGEILAAGEAGQGAQLFERFRYRFDVPAGSVEGGEIPLVFQRHLRPGREVTLLVRLEDLAAGRFFRAARRLIVPEVDAIAPRAPSDPETARLLAAADAALAAGETTIEIVRPMGALAAGLTRFESLVVGEGVEKVAFALDGATVFTKSGPPYSVELDLGPYPEPWTLRATALSAAGEELASDELLLNAGGQRFAVRLTDPVPGRRYDGGVLARAAVEVPDGERLDRLELYVNEGLAATLYGPPPEGSSFAQPLALPPAGEPAYVRAVAHLAGDGGAGDGGSAEDLVWVNAPPGFGDSLDVNLVEVYASVVDRQRRPVAGLGEPDFQVREDGAPVRLDRFEAVADLPIHALGVLDVSASMAELLPAARQAALGFFAQLSNPRDRMALVTFNDRPQLAARFTRDLAQIGGALAGLKAERGTALYDSLIFGLFYAAGSSRGSLPGQRALVVLTDGEDDGSRYCFEDALDYARRSGVTIYAIGLGLAEPDGAGRRLARLAAETGGRAFFPGAAAELTPVYDAILVELRSRYLLAYQPLHAERDGPQRDGPYRRVEVDVDCRGCEVKAIQGYYP